MTIKEQARLLIHPTSPRYERYDARVRFLSRILAFLRRHRVMLILLFAMVLALLLSFLSVVGSYFSEAHCRDYVYGDTPACDARAFMASTKYQYADAAGTPEWQDMPPAAPGEYRIRGVSRNGFGAPKYTNEMTFTLLARDLSLILPSDSILYGELDDAYLLEHAQITGLAQGDRIITADWDIQLKEGPSAYVRLKNLCIKDSYGRDVTECYRVDAPECLIPLLPQPITVSVENTEKQYDGTQNFDTAAQITQGTLAYSDRLDVSFDLLPATVGVYEISANCIIRNADGEDVTHLYQITLNPGKLTVRPRQLTIQTGSSEKVYDATPLVNSEWSVTHGTVSEGHTLKVDLPEQRTVVGKTQNLPVVSILDESGNDMTANYTVTVDSGTLTVTPITLTFETDSAEKVYDGNWLYARGYRLVDGSVLPGHKLSVTVTGSQLFAGAVENGLSVTISTADGAVIDGLGYLVKVNPGTLTVTPRPITIKSDSAEKLYDGTPLVCHKYKIVSGSLAQGDSVYYTDFTGSQTEVGSSDNTFNLRMTHYGLNMQNINYCYSIEYLYGTLTVKENPNYVPPDDPDDPPENPDDPPVHQPGSDTQLGPATPGTDMTVSTPDGTNDTVYATVYCKDTSIGVQRIYFRNTSYGNYTGSGWEAPALYSTKDISMLELTARAMNGTYKAYPMEITLYSQCPILLPYYSVGFDSLDYTIFNDCYILNENKSRETSYELYWMNASGEILGVTQPHWPEEKEYYKYVCENYLEVPQSTRQALMKWAESQGIRSDSPTLIQDIQRAVMNAANYNKQAKDYPDGVDVAVYFLTVSKEGICQHFTTAATLLYRCYGIPARYTSGFACNVAGGKYTDITGNNAHSWVEIYQPSVGWVYVEVTGSSSNPPSTPASDLTIRAAGAVKYYDGMPFSEQQLQQVTVVSGTLNPGHHLEVTFSDISNVIFPGTYNNLIKSYRILDSNGRDVTNQYRNITVKSGTLHIKSRSITVASGSAVKLYDGTPLMCADFWLAQGSLALGDELIVENSGSIQNQGTRENTIKKVKILHTDSRGFQVDATAYYNITLAPGTLTVLPVASE